MTSGEEFIFDCTAKDFEALVIKSEVPVLVDFWAPSCGPCRAMAPTIDAVAEEYAGKVKVGKLNTDDNPGTAARYQIRGIPTLLLFKDGDLKETKVGLASRYELAHMIDKYVG